MKIFEAYNDFYQEISNGEYNRLRATDFDDRYIDDISKALGANFIVESSGQSNTFYSHCIIRSNKSKIKKVSIQVYQLYDEYFKVKSNSVIIGGVMIDRWFKCDQIDGLIECLTNLTTYNRKKSKSITEKRGILTELEYIADDIIEKMIGKSSIRYKFNFKDSNIDVKIKIDPTNKDIGTMRNGIISNSIILSSLDKSVLIHELKHLLYINQNPNSSGFKNSISRSFNWIESKYGKEFNEGHKEIITALFYLIEPDEFEAQYNGLYHMIKSQVEKDPSNKKEIVDRLIKQDDLYKLYTSFIKWDFDIRNWFKDEKYVKPFFNDLYHTINILKKSTIKATILLSIDYYFSFKRKNINTEKAVKNFNRLVNTQVHKNYRKLMRLYSLF